MVIRSTVVDPNRVSIRRVDGSPLPVRSTPENEPPTPPLALAIRNCWPSVGMKLLLPRVMPRKYGCSVPPRLRELPLTINCE
ncbi:MAG: hypothetical protein JO141_08595 [Bradyrhizobium sp.]|nr:hypothetical protein [Bradyrhizobium sp.]